MLLRVCGTEVGTLYNIQDAAKLVLGREMLTFSPPARLYFAPQPPTSAYAAFGACFMHFDAHQPVINDIEARIVTIRDSL